MKQFSQIKLFRSAAAMVLALVLTVPAGAANQDSPVQSALSAYTTVTGELPLHVATFPDAAFLGYVKTLDLDANGSLSAEERAQMVRMDVRNRGIASLQGLEQFPNLEYLNCNNNALTELDLALAPRLQTLFCNDNQLTALDVSAASALQILHCHANQLTALDVSAAIRSPRQRRSLPPPPLPRICPLHRLRQFPQRNRRRPRLLYPSRNRRTGALLKSNLHLSP